VRKKYRKKTLLLQEKVGSVVVGGGGGGARIRSFPFFFPPPSISSVSEHDCTRMPADKFFFLYIQLLSAPFFFFLSFFCHKFSSKKFPTSPPPSDTNLTIVPIPSFFSLTARFPPLQLLVGAHNQRPEIDGRLVSSFRVQSLV
jgi:hypothetical protein